MHEGGLKAGSEVAEGWIQSVNALAWIHLRHDIPILSTVQLF